MSLQMLFVNKFTRACWTFEIFYSEMRLYVSSVHSLCSESDPANVANRVHIAILQEKGDRLEFSTNIRYDVEIWISTYVRLHVKYQITPFFKYFFAENAL